MLVQTQADRIRRLRIADRSTDALALRHSVERAFGGRTLQPSGVAPHVIVCVRHLRMLTPIGATAWADTLDREMQRLVAGAVRPFRDAVPANASVIVFADEAELLACLARDWRRGDGGAWWWRALCDRAISEEVVVRAFVEAPAAMPAALEQLAL